MSKRSLLIPKVCDSGLTVSGVHPLGDGGWLRAQVRNLTRGHGTALRSGNNEETTDRSGQRSGSVLMRKVAAKCAGCYSRSSFSRLSPSVYRAAMSAVSGAAGCVCDV
jgi:hypothetical protein